MYCFAEESQNFKGIRAKLEVVSIVNIVSGVKILEATAEGSGETPNLLIWR